MLFYLKIFTSNSNFLYNLRTPNKIKYETYSNTYFCFVCVIKNPNFSYVALPEKSRFKSFSLNEFWVFYKYLVISFLYKCIGECFTIYSWHNLLLYEKVYASVSSYINSVYFFFIRFVCLDLHLLPLCVTYFAKTTTEQQNLDKSQRLGRFYVGK